jgi:hypothetical protein
MAMVALGTWAGRGGWGWGWGGVNLSWILVDVCMNYG